MKFQYKLAEPDLYPDGLVRAKKGDAGIDLRCREECVTLYPGAVRSIRTGIMLNMSENPNVAAFVVPRSGLGGKIGIVLGNLVGVIDSGYQGEIVCFMWNRNTSLTGQPIHVRRGERFAQMIFLPVLTPELELVEEFLETTERGEGGHGSTGSS